MKIRDPDSRRHRGKVSARHFLGGVGAACLSLTSGISGAESDQNPPPPRFLLEWGRRGQGEGEFSACLGIAIGKSDEVHTAELDKIDKGLAAKQAEFYATIGDAPDTQRPEVLQQLQELRKIRSDADAEALARLTAEQKAAFEEMKGEEVELESQRRRQ